MTADDCTHQNGENVTEEQPAEKPQTPREAKSSVPGGGALARAEKRIDGEMEILGSETDGEPSVSVTLQSGGLSDTSVVLSFSPDTARELAEELEAQAAHSEQWAAYTREHRDRA